MTIWQGSTYNPSRFPRREPPDAQAGQDVPTHLGLRTATFKFVEYATGELEVYDLARDPYELRNQARRTDRNLLRQLADRVRALSRCQGAACRALEAAPLPWEEGE